MTVHSTDAVNCDMDSSLEKSDSSYATAWASQVSIVCEIVYYHSIEDLLIALYLSVIWVKLALRLRGSHPLPGWEL
jgi:hypothetical protein